MIFTVTDTVVTANPAIKLFVRDSYTHENMENESRDIWIKMQTTNRYKYGSDREINTVPDAIRYVSTRCKPVAQRRADVDGEIQKAMNEKKILERVSKETLEINPVVDRLLSSPVLSDFISRTIESLQDQYGNQNEAHRTALALIRDEFCSKIVATYNNAIREAT